MGSSDVFDRSHPELVSNVTLNFSYGIGCARHDLHDSQYAPCRQEPQPEYCSDAWCYVDARCGVSKTASLFRHGRFVSYAECGYVDRWQTSMRAELHDELIVVRLTNSGGWKGSFCIEKDNTCDGVVPRAFEKVLSLSKARPKFLTTFYGGPIQNYPGAYPIDVMEAAFRANPNEKSTFNVCIYATAMGYVDLRLASATATPTRTLLSPSFKMYAEPVYLFAPVIVPDKSLWVYIGKAFKPFQWWTWVLLFGFIMLVSLVFTFQETLADGMYEEHSIIETVAHASYSNFQAFFQAGCTLEPCKGGSRITLLGLGFFLMLATSAYTANLATVLIVKKDAEAKVVLHDILTNKDIKVCSSKTSGRRLQDIGIPEAQLVILLSRSAVLKSIGSECDAGVVSLEDFQALRGRGLHCNLVRVGDPLWYNHYMVTASEKAHRTLSYNFMKVQLSGFWREQLKEFEPADACSKSEDTRGTDEGMAPEDFAGPCAMAGLFVLVGMMFDVSSWLVRKVRGNANVETEGKPAPKNLWVQRPRSDRKTTKITDDTMDAIHALADAFRNGTLRVAPDAASSKVGESDSAGNIQKLRHYFSLEEQHGHDADPDCSAHPDADLEANLFSFDDTPLSPQVTTGSRITYEPEVTAGICSTTTHEQVKKLRSPPEQGLPRQGSGDSDQITNDGIQQWGEGSQWQSDEQWGEGRQRQNYEQSGNGSWWFSDEQNGNFLSNRSPRNSERNSSLDKGRRGSARGAEASLGTGGTGEAVALPTSTEMNGPLFEVPTEPMTQRVVRTQESASVACDEGIRTSAVPSVFGLGQHGSHYPDTATMFTLPPVPPSPKASLPLRSPAAGERRAASESIHARHELMSLIATENPGAIAVPPKAEPSKYRFPSALQRI